MHTDHTQRLLHERIAKVSDELQLKLQVMFENRPLQLLTESKI
jgi:hypothetical protein